MRIFDPGFGRSYKHNTKRIINKDGSFNIVRKGIRKQRYQSLIKMNTRQFIGFVILVYISINLLFAFAYYMAGVEHLNVTSKLITVDGFGKAFYFSMQTFTTVGFGSIFPTDQLSNFISGMEAMAGWMFFALATGLVYGRFSLPSARILFSDNALISPHKGGKAFMFRIVNRRPNVLMEMEAKVMLALDVDMGEEVLRRYFNLKLETSSIHFFPLTWTIVHPIDDSSPFHELTVQELKDRRAEVLILIKGYDDTFSQHVHIRFSYTADEWVWGAKFVRNFYARDDGNIELDIDGVHTYEKVEFEGPDTEGS